MEIGQFVYGMINGVIERRQSQNVDSLLQEDSLKFLYDLEKPGDFVYVWKPENAISRSIIKKTKDCYGRSYRLNHTIIIKFNDDALNFILSETNLLKRIEPFFIQDEAKLPKKLEPITIDL